MVKNKMCPLELLRITHVGNSNFNKKNLRGWVVNNLTIISTYSFKDMNRSAISLI